MDINAEILDYINCNETTGALLLTGSWGCGKSYLIKQIAKDLNDNKKAAVAVISLFGLDSISAINKRVKDEYTNFAMGIAGKTIKKVSKGITKLARDGLAVAGTVAPDISGLSAASQGIAAVMSYDIFNFIEVKNTIGKDDNKRKFVVVFDDFERCGINNEKDLFGAINELVENKQIKVIIVADEEKIGREKYKEYKEKFISRTIRMSNDWTYLVENVVESYFEAKEGYRNFLINNQHLLKLVFVESRTCNIRILKCILADFERVYAAWMQTDIPTDDMGYVLYTFSAEMFESKSPRKENKDSTNSHQVISYNPKEDQYLLKGKYGSQFSSINEWVKYGIWNEKSFKEELVQRYTKKNETPVLRFLTYNFWDLEQRDIDEGLPEAVELAYEGNLSCNQLISLIGKIHILNKNEIHIPVDINYSKMKDGLEKRIINIKKGAVKAVRIHSFIEESEIDEDAYSLLKELNRFDERLIAVKNRAEYINYLSSGDWDTGYQVGRLCIDEFDDEFFNLFTEKYIIADNTGKRALATSILKLSFDSTTYSTKENKEHTKENFDKLIDFLEKFDESDTVTKLINKSFITHINEKFNQKQ